MRLQHPTAETEDETSAPHSRDCCGHRCPNGFSEKRETIFSIFSEKREMYWLQRCSRLSWPGQKNVKFKHLVFFVYIFWYFCLCCYVCCYLLLYVAIIFVTFSFLFHKLLWFSLITVNYNWGDHAVGCRCGHLRIRTGRLGTARPRAWPGPGRLFVFGFILCLQTST